MHEKNKPCFLSYQRQFFFGRSLTEIHQSLYLACQVQKFVLTIYVHNIYISFLLIKNIIKICYSPLPSFLFCSNVTRVTSDSFVPSLRYARRCTPKYRCRPARTNVFNNNRITQFQKYVYSYHFYDFNFSFDTQMI